MSQRKYLKVSWSARPLENAPGDQAAFVEWMIHHAKQHGLRFGLIHADDGVIWGRFDGAAWDWSSGVAPNSPKLNVPNVQQARLFGANAEVFVWRASAALKARLITDEVSEKAAGMCMDESQLLWGIEETPTQDNFRLLVEGSQGLSHAPPKEFVAGKRAKMTARNYIEYDSDGCAFVKASRLVG